MRPQAQPYPTPVDGHRAPAGTAKSNAGHGPAPAHCGGVAVLLRRGSRAPMRYGPGTPHTWLRDIPGAPRGCRALRCHI